MENDYLYYFWDYPFPFSLLLLFLLGFVRIVPIVALAPFYGAKLLPNTAKLGLALSITVVFLPHIVMVSGKIINFDWYYCLLAVKELMIGGIMGILISIPFQTASVAGVLIDNSRGSSQLTALDPTLGTQASPVGQLLNYVLIVVFFALGGPEYYMEGVALSFNFIPPDKMIPAQFFINQSNPFWQTIIGMIDYLMRIAVQLAAPALVAIFMSDLFLGVANRLAQQVPMSFLGWALKSLAGLFILWLAWFFITKQMEKETMDFLRQYISLLMRYAQPSKAAAGI